jgi:hypothetical protein
VHTPEAGKAENKKKKYKEKGDLISTIMAMTDAAKKKCFHYSKQQKASEEVTKAGLCLCKKRKPTA